MPELVYATSPIIHQALLDIGRDGFQDKTVMQRLEQGAPAAGENKEVCDLYQGMFFAGQCKDPNTMIHAIGERAARAQTRLGALLPRDCLSAYSRLLPEGSYAPQIMEAAFDKINQSPAGQKFLPDYPDADAAMVAARLRSRLQHQSQPHLAPCPTAPPLAAPQRKM